MKNLVINAEYSNKVVLCEANKGDNMGNSNANTPEYVVVGNHQYLKDRVTRSSLTITSSGIVDSYSSTDAYNNRYAEVNGHTPDHEEDGDVDVPRWQMWVHTLERNVVSYKNKEVVNYGHTLFFKDWDMSHAVATNMVLRKLYFNDIMKLCNFNVLIGAQFNVVQILCKQGELVHNPYSSGKDVGFTFNEHDDVITALESIKLCPYVGDNGLEQMKIVKSYAEAMAKEGFDAEDILYTLDQSGCVVELSSNARALYEKGIRDAVGHITKATSIDATSTDNSAMMMQMMQMMMQMMKK
jgi:hypothetical protein